MSYYLRGRNLSHQEVEYTPLSQTKLAGISERKDYQDILTNLEKTYFGFVEESKKTEIKSFPQENGKVKLSAGMITHHCSDSLDSLQGISQLGILASEWFGKYESGEEGLFCAFIDRIQEEDCKEAQKINNKRIRSVGDTGVYLFLEESHPVMQELLRMDFFKYMKEKAKDPTEVSKMYSEEELKLLRMIEENSVNATSVSVKADVRTRNWSAIPGGIPSDLVNGILVPTAQICSFGERPILGHDEEYVAELSKLFPNATIFDNKLNVLQSPEQNVTDMENVNTEIPDKSCSCIEDCTNGAKNTDTSENVLTEYIRYKESIAEKPVDELLK